MSLTQQTDPLPQSVKIQQVVALTRISYAITLQGARSRDYRIALSKLDKALEELRRLPGNAKLAAALGQERASAQANPLDGPAIETLRAAEARCKEAIRLGQAEQKRHQKEREKLAKQRKKDSVREIQYQGLRAEVMGLLRSIDGQPLLPSVQDLGARAIAARQALHAADGELASGDLDQAFDLLSTAKERAEGVLADWGKAVRPSKKKQGKEAHKILTLVMQEIEGAAVLSQQQKDNAKSGAHLKFSPLFDAPGKSSVAEEVIKALTEYHGEVRAFIKEQQERRDQARKAVAPAVRGAEKLADIALPREIGEELKMASDVRKLLIQGEYARAEELAQKLAQRLEPLRPGLEQARDAWAEIEKKGMAELQTMLRDQAAAMAGTTFTYKDTQADLLAALDPIAAAAFKTRTYAESVADFEEVKKIAEEDARLFAAWGGLADDRDKADAVVQAAAKDALKALEELEAALQEAEGSGEWTSDSAGGMRGTYDEILRGWARDLGMVADAGEIDPEPAAQELRDLAQSARASAADPKACADLVTQDKRDAAVYRYWLLYSELYELLPAWEIFPIPSAAEIRSRFEAITDTVRAAETAEEIAPLHEEAEGLLERGRSQASLVDSALQDARSNLRGEVQKARQAVEALEKAAGKRSLLDKSKIKETRERCQQQAIAFREGIDAIEGLHTSDVLDVFHRGTIELRDIAAQARALTALCDGKPETEPLLPETFAKIIEVSRLKIGVKAFTRFRPSQQFVLGQQLDAVAAKLGKEHTSAVQKALADWDRDYAAALALVAADEKSLAAFEDLHDDVTELLKTNAGLFKGYGALLKKLKRDLKGAERQAGNEDGIEGAIAATEGVRLAVERVLKAKDPGKELKLRDDEAAAAVARQGEQKAAWAARVKVFEKRWLPKLQGQGQADVQKLLDLANKTADQEDFDTANRYLQAAAERAALLIEFPDGPAATSLKRLPGVGQRWAAAVPQYQASLRGFRDRFAGMDDPTRSAALAELDEMGRLFDANAFARIIQSICKSGASTDDRLRRREAGLQIVRRYKETLTRDARFRLLRDHPFDDVGAWTGHLVLQQPLSELERLLLMAVPTT